MSVHAGVTGLVITITVKNDAGLPLDLSQTVTKEFRIKTPSDAVLTRVAANVTDGGDGQLTYTSVAGDIEEVGIYRVQVYLDEVLGWKGGTDLLIFEVAPNL